MSPASNRASARKPKAPAREEPRPQGALTRQDIALAIANKCENVSKREAKRLVDSAIDEIVEDADAGRKFEIARLWLVHRARQGRAAGPIRALARKCR